jgi:hypothetical protein
MKCTDFLPELSPTDKQIIDSLVETKQLGWSLVKLPVNNNVPKPYFRVNDIVKIYDTSSYLLSNCKGHRINLNSTEGHESAQALSEFKKGWAERYNTREGIKSNQLAVCDAHTLLHIHQHGVKKRSPYKRNSSIQLSLPKMVSEPDIISKPAPRRSERELQMELATLSLRSYCPMTVEWAVPDPFSDKYGRRFDLLDKSQLYWNIIEIVEVKAKSVTLADLKQKVETDKYLQIARLIWPEARCLLVFVAPEHIDYAAYCHIRHLGCENKYSKPNLDYKDVEFRTMAHQKDLMIKRMQREHLIADFWFLLKEVREFIDPSFGPLSQGGH